jgi:hypothetical protein
LKAERDTYKGSSKLPPDFGFLEAKSKGLYIENAKRKKVTFKSSISG